MKEFITYGHWIKKDKFIPAYHTWKMEFLNKPGGGLWCSPKDSNWGWRDWCESEKFRLDRLNKYSTFRLKEKAKVLVIESLEDLEDIMVGFGRLQKIAMGSVLYPDMKCIDWDNIKNYFDAVLLTEKGNEECHLPYALNSSMEYIDLNSWDCESMVILRWEAIDESSIVHGKRKKKEEK